MPQPQYLTALKIPIPEQNELKPDMRKYFGICEEKLGLIPNVLKAYSFDSAKLQIFVDFYNELMLAESGLSKLEREMIAVVVSSANRCYYCLTAHGSAVRHLSGDAQLGEALAMNWRVAVVTPRQRALLEFAHTLTVAPAEAGHAERSALRAAGWSDRDIWDISNVVGFFNFSNRVATAVDLMPNPEYHSQAR